MSPITLNRSSQRSIFFSMYSPLPKRKSTRAVVQLTSLLDLLFVMIFVSLMQQKTIKSKATTEEVKTPPPVAAKVKPKKKGKFSPSAYSISATFHFYKTASNQKIPDGKFLMQGSYKTKTGNLRLGGIAWIERPKNYEMIPLSGVIKDKKFIGKIEFIGCKTFTLNRVETFDSTPISGVWKGTYDCSQGETGLTLTIE